MTTTADYRTDSEFVALVDLWRDEGRPPLPLADWLRDRGLDGPADAVAWCCGQDDVDGGDGHGGVRPWRASDTSECVWNRKCGGYRFRSDVPATVVDRMGVATHPTFADAVVALLDAWEVPT